MKAYVLSELKAINNMIKRLMMSNCSNHAAPSNLSPQQMHIIGYVKHAEEQNIDVFQRDLEFSLNVRPSTATGIIKVLEKNGYLLRVSVPQDARLKKIILTNKSKDIFVHVDDFLEETEKMVLNGITDEERKQFLIVVDKMKKNLKSMTKNQDRKQEVH